MKYVQSKRNISKAGFTLIELMVSLTIFSIVMLISVGTLLTLIDANAKAQALYMATTNISFALDVMTRDIRTGHYYRCENVDNGNHFGQENNSGNGYDNEYTKDCASGGEELVFTRDWSNVRVGYRLSEGQIEQKIGYSGSWVPLTSLSTLNVTSLEFVVQNSKAAQGGNNYSQPTITISVQGEVADGIEDDSVTDFDIQTQIISRRLDII